MIKVLFSFLSVCMFAVIGVFLYFYSQIRLDSNLIIDYKPPLTTQVLDRNGNLIANVFDKENRVYVKYEDIPARVIEALVAVEDTIFFEHKGINIEAIFRALAKDIKAMSFIEGASTITQQLIKNIALSGEKKIDRKIKEAVLALKIENELSKEEILERYLNEVYFGHGYYGIKTAALGYFRKDLNDLSLKEIAILVGLPQAPSSYDPTRHLDLSLSRANAVLRRMYDIGWVGEEQYQISTKEIPEIYDDSLTKNKAPYAVDEIIKEAIKIFPDIKTGGYIIETSVDLGVQNMAQEALVFGHNEILKRDKDANASILNGAIVVTNPITGDILALSGGIDYTKSNFNRATQSSRQPGSSFKPFIFQIALDMGYSPMSQIADEASVFDDGKRGEWRPKNFDNKYEGNITIKQAITMSRNLATINLLYDMGVDKTQKILLGEGFKNIPPALSIALGSFGISPLEYSSFYSMFPALGVASKSKFITSITDQNGQVTTFTTTKHRMTQPEQAYLMVDLMRNVVKNGTGRRAQVNGVEIAGKTGTSNDSIDAWFCGFTPELQVIIWYGNDNYTPMRKVEGGGRTAAPVFAKFIQSYIKEYPLTKKKFSMPNGVYSKNYNGKNELYTTTSPLPAKADIPTHIDEDYLRSIAPSNQR